MTTQSATMLPCPCCKGSKINTLTGKTINADGTVTMHEPFVVNCYECKGVGSVTQEHADARARELAQWCTCGNPSRDVKYHPDNQRGAAYRKHHWTCKDCGKVTQIG